MSRNVDYSLKYLDRGDCMYFRQNFILELPELRKILSKRWITFIYARDRYGYKDIPYCRYGYNCIGRETCPFKPQIITQLTLF